MNCVFGAKNNEQEEDKQNTNEGRKDGEKRHANKEEKEERVEK